MRMGDWMIEVQRWNDAGCGDPEGLEVKWVGELGTCVEAMIGGVYDL